jgi:hypothetical protein
VIHDLLLLALGMYAGVFLYDACSGFRLTRWADRQSGGGLLPHEWFGDGERSTSGVPDDATIEAELERMARL